MIGPARLSCRSGIARSGASRSGAVLVASDVISDQAFVDGDPVATAGWTTDGSLDDAALASAGDLAPGWTLE